MRVKNRTIKAQAVALSGPVIVSLTLMIEFTLLPFAAVGDEVGEVLELAEEAD